MKKKNSILMLMIVMTLALCTACGDKTSENESLNSANSTQVSEPSSNSESITNYFDLTVNNGTGSQTHVQEGTTVTVIANEPSVGMTFSHWEDDVGQIISFDSTYTFMIVKNTTLTATYAYIDVIITVIGGSKDSESYKYNDTVTITANEAQTGYVFEGWEDETGNIISNDEVYTFIATKNITLTATYVLKDIHITVINGTGSNTYKYGDNVTIVANTPEEGYRFAAWKNGDVVVSSDETYIFDAKEDLTLTATYELLDVELIVNNGTGSNIYKYGDIVTVVANEPEEGKVFSGWRNVLTDTIVSKESTYTFKITSDLELTAEYQNLILHVTVHNGTGTGDYEYGTKITIVADQPELGKVFKLFMDEHGKTLSYDQEFELTVTEDMVITAVYQTINYTITVINGTGGKDYFMYGDQCSVTANNIPGKIFVGWEEDGTIVSTNNPYTFIVTKDRTLTAKFEEVPYTSEKPENYSDVVNLVSHAALIENNLSSMSFKEQNNTNMIDENRATILNMTFYKDGVIAEGTGQPYSSMYSDPYSLLHAYQIKDGKLFEVIDFGGSNYSSSSYEKATAKNMVYDVTNNDLEILDIDASQLVENFGVISKLATILADFNDTSALNVEDIDGGYKVTLSKVLPKETSTMYGTYDLEIVVDGKDGFILSYSYSHKSYVRATWVEDSSKENSPLKPNATPRDHIFTIVEVTRSTNELENMPKEVANEKINKNFISDFSFSGYYYQGGSTRREFNEENPVLAPGINSNSFYWSMINVTPTTAIESKNLYFLSSSNEDVITINSTNRSINTISEGTSDVVVASSAGICKTITFTVSKLPPVSINITSENKVLINETIELVATVSPTDSIEDVIWSLDNYELAEIIEENGKTVLKGKASGFVTVTATSAVDGNIKGTKTIYVSAGPLSTDELKEAIVGTWQIIMSTFSNTGFTFTFNKNGTVTIVDTYRGATARISCIATWELTTKVDSEKPHNGTYYSIHNDDYYVIELTIIEMTDSPAYSIPDFHLLIANDGSSLIYHFIPGSNSASTQEGSLTKIN